MNQSRRVVTLNIDSPLKATKDLSQANRKVFVVHKAMGPRMAGVKEAGRKLGGEELGQSRGERVRSPEQ